MNSQVDVGAVCVDAVCLSTIPGGYLIQTQELLEAADSRTPSRCNKLQMVQCLFFSSGFLTGEKSETDDNVR